MSAPFRPPRARPDGDVKACPHCGMTGIKDRITHWNGTTPEFDHADCATCSGAGWLPAPPYYKLPHGHWPGV